MRFTSMQFMPNYHTCTKECEPLGKEKVQLCARVVTDHFNLQPFAHGSTPDPPPCLNLAQTQSPTDRLYVLRPQLQQVGDLSLCALEQQWVYPSSRIFCLSSECMGL